MKNKPHLLLSFALMAASLPSASGQALPPPADEPAPAPAPKPAPEPPKAREVPKFAPAPVREEPKLAPADPSVPPPVKALPPQSPKPPPAPEPQPPVAANPPPKPAPPPPAALPGFAPTPAPRMESSRGRRVGPAKEIPGAPPSPGLRTPLESAPRAGAPLTTPSVREVLPPPDSSGRPPENKNPGGFYYAEPGGNHQFHRYGANAAPQPSAEPLRFNYALPPQNPGTSADQIIRDIKIKVFQRHFESTLSESLEVEKALLDAPQDNRPAMEAKLKALQNFAGKLESDLRSLDGRTTRNTSPYRRRDDPNSGTRATPYAPGKATGAPDAGNHGNDSVNAWCPASTDSRYDYLRLNYDREVEVASIGVFETNASGALSRVIAVRRTGDRILSEHILWNGVESVEKMPFTRVFEAPTGVMASEVRLEFEPSRIRHWQEIDAVELTGRDGSRQWAKTATASSYWGAGTPTHWESKEQFRLATPRLSNSVPVEPNRTWIVERSVDTVRTETPPEVANSDFTLRYDHVNPGDGSGEFTFDYQTPAPEKLHDQPELPEPTPLPDTPGLSDPPPVIPADPVLPEGVRE